jgi:4-amino-4-deoxy-L-arabinose transferase-like glycosyltransferase
MSTHDNNTSCRPLALLAAVIAVVMFVFPLFIPFPLLDPDEGLHAAIAQEMVERGNWITPHFLGEPFLDKPIFYFWMQAASLKWLGTSEAAIRLPGLLFGLLGAATTGLLAARLFGRRTGWIAGVLYATTILPTVLAQAASHDVALVPWINLTLLWLWDSEQTRRWRYVLGAGLFLGLSILTKGLMGVAVVSLTYGTYASWRMFRDPMILVRGTVLLAVAAVIAGPWYLAVESDNPGFLLYYFVERHLLALTTDTQPHSNQPWWYYLPILLGGGLPWIGYLGREKGEGGRGKTTVPLSAFPLPPSPFVFLWFWLIVWTVLLTLGQSKLVTYLWPAFPPVAILAAVTWTRLIDERRRGTVPFSLARQLGQSPSLRRAARTFVISSWSGPVVLPAAVAAVQWVCGVRLAWPAWTAVAIVAAATPLPLIVRRSKGWQAALAAATLSVAAQFVVVMMLVMPPVAENYSARQLAQYFNRQQKLPPRLLMVEERIGSLVFYLDPRLRAGLKRGQLQSLYADPPVRFRRGDVVALAEQKVAKAAEYLDFGKMSYESVGRHRLYRMGKPVR